MARNINRFIKEIAEYINTYIAGSENTYIVECVPLDKVFNRGHAIMMKVRMPEYIADQFKSMGPTFYAEELMDELPNSTVAAIAEVLNARTTEHYPTLMKMLEKQGRIMDKTINDYGKEDIVLTALPSSQVFENLNDSSKYIVKECPELCLTVTIKGCTHDDTENENESYFVPVCKGKDRDIVKKDWDRAETNSMNLADIHIVCMPIPAQIMGEKDIQVCGQITDMNRFYDYFYLLSAKKIWSDMVKKFDADRLYIIPCGAYEAKFIIDNDAVRKNKEARALRGAFIAGSINESDKIMPMFVFDGTTLELTKLDNFDFRGM